MLSTNLVMLTSVLDWNYDDNNLHWILYDNPPTDYAYARGVRGVGGMGMFTSGRRGIDEELDDADVEIRHMYSSDECSMWYITTVLVGFVHMEYGQDFGMSLFLSSSMVKYKDKRDK